MAIKKVKLPDNTTVELNDARVDVSSPSNGQVLAYNSTSQKFENQSISTGGGDVYFGDGEGSGNAATILSGVTMNGSSVTVTDGVANLGTVVTDKSDKQDTLVSGTNIKTVNNNSLLGSGDVAIATPGTLVTNATTAQSASSGEAMSGSITLHKVAKTGTYSDLIGIPSIPSAPGTLNTTATTAQSTNSSEALSGNITLHKVSKTGTYSDLIGTPTIPTVNNSTITIQKNGTTVDSFTTNASSGKSINITVSEPPSVSSSDNGKVMVVSSGSWAAVQPVTIYSGSSAPSSGTGSNGDIYIQTES